MAMRYFKRFRMEIDFARVDLPPAQLPAGFCWVPWDETTIARHARVKYESFGHECDAQVFASFNDYNGCLRLMREIANQPTFIPASTWLIAAESEDGNIDDCGTIQGIGASDLLGSIQNVGVCPERRRLGLGRALVLRALHGFRDQGMSRVYLEVTSQNDAATTLYHEIGFRIVRTMYRANECEPVGMV